jgi:hypothetical protein
MRKSQEIHLKEIKERFLALVDKKYRKGAKEHGGELRDVQGIIDMAIEEAIDQVTYLFTLKDQLDSGNYYKIKGKDKK